MRFHDKSDPQKKYPIDYWVVPKGDKLMTLEERIYKAPTKNGKDWTMMQRQPKPWWWIPAAEHPGETEEKRSWEAMSSIDRYVQRQADKNKGAFQLKDDKTGKTIPLEFLYVHQPVRRLKENGVFFRKATCSLNSLKIFSICPRDTWPEFIDLDGRSNARRPSAGFPKPFLR